MEQVGEGADSEANAGDGRSGAGEAECEVINLKLPWPPSLNHYYRMVAGRMLISKEGRDYCEEIGDLLSGGFDPITGRIGVTIQCHAPDNRRRDLDNVFKCLGDSLTKAGIWKDDSQIDDLRLIRRDSVKGGMVLVEIRGI